MPEADAKSYLSQMVEGLLLMKRSVGLAHHDVSLENVMLDGLHDGQAQIIDMGMCLHLPPVSCGEGTTGRRLAPMLVRQRCSGKAGYVSPEVVREEPFCGFAADIWSLGVCLYIMLTGRPLYGGPKDEAFKILSHPGGSRAVVSAYESYGMILPSLAAKDLVCAMLDADPTKRPTLEELACHPYVRQVPREKVQEVITSHLFSYPRRHVSLSS